MQSDIRALVDDFTSQLEQTIRRMALEQVEAALTGAISGTTRRRGPGRPPKSAAGSRRTAKGGKRDAGAMEEMQATLLAHVRSNPGQRGEQIAEALGTDVGTMRLPMKKLIAARAVRTEGQRRGMTYFAGSGGGGPTKAKTGGKKATRRAGKRRGRKVRSGGAKAEVAAAAAA